MQPSLQRPIVEMRHLAASLELSDGPAEITALGGAYNFDTGRVVVPGPVNVIAPGGYRLVTNDVDIDLRTHRLLASGRVQGELSTGTFSANTMMADLEARTITLQGNVRMRMTPGKLSFPK